MNQSNDGKVIYDLCGGTGSWSEPYRAAGYSVRVVDLLNIRGDNYYTGDIREFKFSAKESIYGILAAPPCEEFSLAKQAAARNLGGGMSIVMAVMHLIWFARLNCDLQFWALENPVGYLRQFLGIAPYKFKQWEFGEPFRKPTEIWGYFNPPAKIYQVIPPKENLFYVADIHGKNRKRTRAITPKSFAKAFFLANQ